MSFVVNDTGHTTEHNRLLGLGDFCTPEQFGAVGDGVTDDTVALQAAIDYIIANESVLYISNPHLISAQLDITPSDKWKIIGSNFKAKIIQSADNTRIFSFNGSFSRAFRISGLDLTWSNLQTGNTNAIAFAFTEGGEFSAAWGFYDFIISDIRLTKGYLAFGQTDITVTNPIWGCVLENWIIGSDWCGPVVINRNTAGGSPNFVIRYFYLRCDSMNGIVPFHFENIRGLTISDVEINDSAILRAFTIETCFAVSLRNVRSERVEVALADGSSPCGILFSNAEGSVDGFEIQTITCDRPDTPTIIFFGVRASNNSTVSVDNLKLVSATYVGGSTSNGLSVDTSHITMVTSPKGFSIAYNYSARTVISGVGTTNGSLYAGAHIEVGEFARRILSGNGSPEGAITASVGSIYMRADGGAGTTMYVKETGSGNTGWAAK